MGVGEWEGSQNGTAWAINLVPRDIVICDWHYEAVSPTAAYFAAQGFRVVAATGRMTIVALGQLDLIYSVRTHADKTIAPRTLGVLQTTWTGPQNFIKAYHRDKTAPRSAAEAAYTFKALFNTIRALQ
jgi:hypothetical protein